MAFGVVSLRGLTYLGPTTKAEGNQLDAILRLREGKPLYVDFAHEPFLVTPYPPIMYSVDALITSVLGFDIYQTAVASRAVSLLASVASVIIVFNVTRSMGAGRVAATAAASWALAFPFMDGWAFTIRSDALAIMLSLLGALILLRAPGGVYAAAVLAVLAFFTKQTMVAFPVASVIWLWLEGRRRDASLFVAIWGGLVAGVFVALHIASGGVYELNTVLAHLNPTNGFDAAARAFLQLSGQA